MALYRIHFVTHSDDIFGTEYFDSEEDTQAINQAFSVYRSGIGKGYEVWQGDRHVHTEVYR